MRTLDQLDYLPRPRHIKADPLKVATGTLTVTGIAPAELTVSLQRALAACRLPPAPDPVFLSLHVAPSATVPPGGYRLAVVHHGVALASRDFAGAHAGLMTLLQILRQCPDALPCGIIEDWPDFAARGVMLDISRDKVPTLETLFALVDDLSEWKVNHLQLYMEHTFAYPQHRVVWEHASPLTADDVRRLDAYCRERFIELAPNQNCFGHMGRWLRHARYRPLAECPDGYRAPDGEWRAEPSTLDPTNPASLGFIEGLLDELLPLFTSRRLHIGCDETWELGQGHSREACVGKGLHAVYLDFIRAVNERVRHRGFTSHYWGDMVWNQFPARVPELDRSMVMVDWGYYRRYPFAAHGEALAAARVPFWFAPGTSVWATLLGCNEAGFGSNRSACEQGLRSGAGGILNTDWGDGGHWQYLPVSYAPFAAGAAMAWCLAANPEDGFRGPLDTHVFRDPTRAMAGAVLALADAWEKVGRGTTQAHTFDRILRGGLDQTFPQGVTAETLAEAEEYISTAAECSRRSRMLRSDAALIVDELRNGARMAIHACHRGQAILKQRDGKPFPDQALAKDAREFLAEHRRLWLARNRPGGLADSCRRFEELVAEYSR
jgi:hypothetical protein